MNVCGGPNDPGAGSHGLMSWTSKEMVETHELWSEDRDALFVQVPNGGFDEQGSPVHVDKVWNHLKVPYDSFIVEVK